MGNIPRSEYPRPQLVRKDWINLNGEWTYVFDFGNSGLDRGWEKSTGFDQKILVPFCPESELSGVNHKDFIEYMFYQRFLEIPAEWSGKRILLHFGAVDYYCEGYIDGVMVGQHTGGSSSFTFDLTEYVKCGEKHSFVLRVEDHLRAGGQASGKQCPDYKSRACHYTRVTGIWQTVWLEATAMAGLKRCRIIPDFDGQSFCFNPEFFDTVPNGRFEITILAEGRQVGSCSVVQASGIPVKVPVSELHPWQPGSPFLYDITYVLKDGNGAVMEELTAYSGMRKIQIQGDMVMLNNQPLYQRLVLDQGYYPDGIWTAPSDAALKRDIELSMAVGFNGARLHQKVFEERFHYWADKLGYLTWGESASWGIDQYDALSRENFCREWRECVERDANHPSIITWTPTNETWVATATTAEDCTCHRQHLLPFRRFYAELYDLTKAIDPSRPVNDCSGYTHVKTDLWTTHVYRGSKQEVYDELMREPVSHFFSWNIETGYHGQPYINDECGGFKFTPPERKDYADNSWGYYGMDLKDGEALVKLISDNVEGMLEVPHLRGFCYTQLTDVEQEENGIYYYDRTPKLPGVPAEKLFKRQPEGYIG